MIDEYIKHRQNLHSQLASRRVQLGAASANDEQILAWKQEIQHLSMQIREINRSSADENAAVELPHLMDEGYHLPWVHGHAIEGVPFAGRAVSGAFIINYACARTRKGDKWNLQLYLNHRHMSNQMGARRRTVALEASEAYRLDEFEHVLAQMLRDVCSAWLVRHAHA